MSRTGTYDLTALGWLLFEQLCAAWLERAVGLSPEWWVGSADRHRYAILEGGLPASLSDPHLPGPTLVATAWTAAGEDEADAAIVSTLSQAWRAASRPHHEDSPLRSLLVLTNLPAERVRESLGSVTGPPCDRDESLPVHVLGVRGLGAAIDEDLELRLQHPFLMGVRDGGPVLPDDACRGSTLDLEAARELSRVYVPSGPYRPEAAERWARALPEILRAMDERHWLIVDLAADAAEGGPACGPSRARERALSRAGRGARRRGGSRAGRKGPHPLHARQARRSRPRGATNRPQAGRPDRRSPALHTRADPAVRDHRTGASRVGQSGPRDDRERRTPTDRAPDRGDGHLLPRSERFPAGHPAGDARLPRRSGIRAKPHRRGAPTRTRGTGARPL